ncbi:MULTISPECIES: pentapeptide repeat-containing protein [unclassified Coleofasciculus]|uniref:pentapeptide repeat-containing protein n=1 Tax=unclassified Coleofasciculus TaxID=2692782 RepID=UPI001880E333|nr:MULTISPECIES: pentapeptide repeat-containing protein [unclassified Coleofasciculus]MBE9126105.1 pentapeptide repeat-containing protein [Coleofasciculus sp. LEGE 07081]MBE9147540.1 pentapeptide repeat-containing protein [Coleofasciculus sp. LEGE 07092]
MKFVRYFPKLLIKLVLLFLLLLISTPALAATTQPERTPLTLELLQERINSPIQSEGVSTINLRQFVIDLTSENAEFRDQFYLELQTKINRSKTPLGIDLSQSLIQGEFTTSKLGLPTPLSKAALPPLLTPTEQEQLQRDTRFLTEASDKIPSVTVFRGVLKLNQARLTGAVNFADTFFLQRVEASDTVFVQEVNGSGSSFGRPIDFSSATFGRDTNFSGSTFFGNAGLTQVEFRGTANFTGSTFYETANFSRAEFSQLANFTRIQWVQDADFSQVKWHDRSLFSKSRFNQSLLLTEATFEKSATFRGSQFRQPVLMRDVSLLDQVDFSNTRFVPDAYLNVAGMTFDSDQAKVFGEAGQIGRVLSVPRLEGNEDVLRNLVRNFREQEQITDANRIEYTTERLRREQLWGRLVARLLQVMSQEEINTVSSNWVLDTLHWMGLSLLLLLSADGTSFGLVFGVGTIAIAYFGLLFWLLDRWRRRYPKPILPRYLETVCMVGSGAAVTFGGAIAIFRTSTQPWLTLLCLGGILLPVPLLLVGRLYRQGRYHDMLDVTYFVEDGGMRQLRLLIGRLPVMPRFGFFRDRYMPILWDRRWNWLNYYDFSFNNLLKFGFNDIRLRDLHVPGILTTLAWYQWSLGILYIALLLWTLSRTIPGLNLLIYLK